MTQERAPIMQPDLVRGTVAKVERQPDRRFRLLDPSQHEEIVWEADGFVSPVDPDEWTIVALCPRGCGQQLRIDTTVKAHTITQHGIISHEPMTCPTCLYRFGFVSAKEDQRRIRLRGGGIISIDAVVKRM